MLSGCGWLPPTGSTSLCSSTRSSFTCTGQRNVGQLVEEDGAAVGQGRAGRARAWAAPVNAPLTWPNSSLSTRLGLRAATWTGRNGRSRRVL